MLLYLTKVLGREVREKGARKEIELLNTTEENARTLAQNLGLQPPVQNRAPHSKDEVGEVVLVGKPRGNGLRQPLNQGCELVKDQSVMPSKQIAYNVNVLHDDGFNEEVELEFRLLGYARPHIFFAGKPSRKIVKHVEDNLLGIMGV